MVNCQPNKRQTSPNICMHTFLLMMLINNFFPFSPIFAFYFPTATDFYFPFHRFVHTSLHFAKSKYRLVQSYKHILNYVVISVPWSLMERTNIGTAV